MSNSVDVIQITPKELAEDLKRHENLRLLDVRTPEEHKIAHIEGAQLVDEKLVGEIVESWPKDTRIVTHCHHGMRSLDAAQYLTQNGFTNVKSLQGGIDAWSTEVDPTVPRYEG